MYIHGYYFMLCIYKTQFTQFLYVTYFRNIPNKNEILLEKNDDKIHLVLGNVLKLANFV